MSKPSAGSLVIASLMALLLLHPFNGAAASTPAAVGAEYEIPLSDLKTVEKKTKKPVRKARKEKSKPDNKAREESVSASRPAEASGRTVVEATKADKGAVPEAMPSQPTATALHPAEPVTPAAGDNPVEGASPAEEEGARITHAPNSFVIVGKRTIIKAVISSLDELRFVRCHFRTAANDGYAFVPMVKEEGSRYTYTAILPPLAEGSKFLRYRFVAADIPGNMTKGNEFVIPVKRSLITPGWQMEASQEPAAIGLEDPLKPIDGFKDISVDPQPKP